jgi:hypothetical protein
MSVNLGELATATFEKILPSLHDNLIPNIPLYRDLAKKGRTKTYDGGTQIRANIKYASNETYTRYNHWQRFNIQSKPTIDAAQYSPKYVMVSMSISGQEELENSGSDTQLVNLVTAKTEGMQDDFIINMNIDLWSDGSLDAGRQVNGMRALISDTPSSGIVGSINSATFPFWRNFSFDATTDGGAAATSANIPTYMTTVMTSRLRDSNLIDLIYADNNYWNLYHGSKLSIERIVDRNAANRGSLEIEFMNRPVVNAGGYNGAIAANHMYFVNSKTLDLYVHKKRNYSAVGGDRLPLDQDGRLKLVGWAGNLVCSSRLDNAVLKD